MVDIRLVYNERAWAIEVMQAITEYAQLHEGKIRRATGEYGVRQAGHHTLFPDILLFADDDFQTLLQGWELKFPETDADASEVIENARQKALALGLKSFLTWNVNEAVLWVLNGEGQAARQREWHLEKPVTRITVATDRQRWKRLLETILADLNDLFAGNAFRHKDVSFGTTIACVCEALIERSRARLAKHLKKLTIGNRSVAVELARWAQTNKCVADEKRRPEEGVADALLLAWVLRLLSAHGMATYYNALRHFCSNPALGSCADTLAQFRNIVQKCDHAHLFGEGILDACLPDEVWNNLCALHAYLCTVVISTPNRQNLQRFVERLIPTARKKFLGQFSTPPPLARLLVRIAGMRLGAMWDPCCGTGTIVQALCALREDAGESPATARTKVWGTDIDEFPLRLASVALSHPEATHVPIRIFQKDSASLVPHALIPLIHPDTGTTTEEPLPTFDLIASNLPFVRFEDAPEIALPDVINGRADYAVKLLLTLERHLSKSGSLALILPNAWFGTDWGRDTFRFLTERYDIESVTISGYGRWFSNAKIVTSMLTLTCKGYSPYHGTIVFAVTRKPIEQWTDVSTDSIAQAIIAHQKIEDENVFISLKTTAEILSLLDAGLALTAAFSDMTWWQRLTPHLIPCETVFEIGRGARWGWDEFFFPEDDMRIESRYLLPLVKSSSEQHRLTAIPNGKAFCCDKSIAELKAEGATGALARIEKYKSRLSERPTLAKKAEWYRVKRPSAFVFALPLNPYERHLAFLLPEDCVLNQRLTGLIVRPEWNNHRQLLHALLNSSLMAFLCEATGFGRGEGVLDTSTTSVKRLPFPNPGDITPKHEMAIVNSFNPLLKRDILPLREEMKQPDRQIFERTVLEAFGLKNEDATTFFNDLFKLYELRLSVLLK